MRNFLSQIRLLSQQPQAALKLGREAAVETRERSDSETREPKATVETHGGG